MMEKNKKRKFSYNNLHTLIFGFTFAPIFIYIMHRIKGEGMDWMASIFGFIFMVVLQIICQSFFYKMEIKDEMVQYDLARANKITLYTILAVLFVGLILENFIHGFICTDFCWLTLFGGIALRSMLFTIFDTPSQADSKGDEE